VLNPKNRKRRLIKKLKTDSRFVFRIYTRPQKIFQKKKKKGAPPPPPNRHLTFKKEPLTEKRLEGRRLLQSQGNVVIV